MSKQDKGKEPMGDKADSVALSKYLSKANMQGLASWLVWLGSGRVINAILSVPNLRHPCLPVRDMTLKC